MSTVNPADNLAEPEARHQAGLGHAPAPAAQPPAPAQPDPAQPPRSPEEIAAGLEARRRALAADVDEVAARLAPTSLKRLARQRADAAVADLRTRTDTLREQAEALASQAGLTRTAPTASRAPQPAEAYGAATGQDGAARAGEPQSLPQRLTRLLNDARDGDPVCLAVVTGVALGLAGVSALALTKAVRR